MPIWFQASSPFITLVLGALLGHWLSNRRHKKERQEKKTDDAYITLQEKYDILEGKYDVAKSRIDEFEAIEFVPNSDYYILKATRQTICPICWSNSKKVIPVRDNGTGFYHCGNCKAHGVYSQDIVDKNTREQERIGN